MKCRNCGAELSDNHLVCPVCGCEVQIVPDYNPLDDVLTEQVKGAINETLKININQEQLEKYNNSRKENPRNTGRTSAEGRPYRKSVGAGQSVNVANDGERNTVSGVNGKNSSSNRKSSSSNRKSGSLDEKGSGTKSRSSEQEMMRDQREARKRRAEKKRQLAKKKRQRLIIIMVAVILALVGMSVYFYQTSYTGRIKSAYKYLNNKDYSEAESRFEKAIAKKKTRSEAYTGLAEVWLAQGDQDKAEQVFLDAIAAQPTNAKIYEAAILFYIETKQEGRVMPLIESCVSDDVKNALKDYQSSEPEFSLDDKDVYDEVQALELTGNGEAIYYTTDGTDPTTSSEKYTEAIKLGEGQTEVRAISVNKKGIPSLVVKKVYTVEFPIEAAPSVTPSTGHYEENQDIKVVVPDGYTAYYTTDGSDPKTSGTRIQYTGPFAMPEGNTFLNVVLMDSKERYSDVTKRNYELILSNEE